MAVSTEDVALSYLSNLVSLSVGEHHRTPTKPTFDCRHHIVEGAGEGERQEYQTAAPVLNEPPTNTN